jgi:hypothetical protein
MTKNHKEKLRREKIARRRKRKKTKRCELTEKKRNSEVGKAESDLIFILKKLILLSKRKNYCLIGNDLIKFKGKINFSQDDFFLIFRFLRKKIEKSIKKLVFRWKQVRILKINHKNDYYSSVFAVNELNGMREVAVRLFHDIQKLNKDIEMVDFVLNQGDPCENISVFFCNLTREAI